MGLYDHQSRRVDSTKVDPLIQAYFDSVLIGRSVTNGLVPSPTTTVSQHHPRCGAHCTMSTTMDIGRTENETDTGLHHHDPTATRDILPAFELFCTTAIEEQRKAFITMLEE